MPPCSPSRQIRQSKIQNPKSKIPITSYRKAGVDIEGADAWIARMRPRIRSTHRVGVLADRGQFAGLFRLAALRLRDPVLVASTDGVGTKLLLARTLRDYETIGVDTVAMNTNDVLVYGAQPLFFLDYLAVGKIGSEFMSSLLRGIVRGCHLSDCALLGGETAEMPGVYERGEYDVAGFCVGAVERRHIIDGSRIKRSDAIVGLSSSGLHANGFSLVRRVFSKKELMRLSNQLLIPTRIYVKPVLKALEHFPIRATAHITGGGLARRLPSLAHAASGLRACLFEKSWPIASVFGTIQHAGALSAEEMMSTFNMGIGMALVCPRGDAKRLIRFMQRFKIPAWEIGVMDKG